MGGPGGKKGMRGPVPKPKNAKGTVKRLLKYILKQKGSDDFDIVGGGE